MFYFLNGPEKTVESQMQKDAENVLPAIITSLHVVWGGY